jgi:hypothetical protein
VVTNKSAIPSIAPAVFMPLLTTLFMPDPTLEYRLWPLLAAARAVHELRFSQW